VTRRTIGALRTALPCLACDGGTFVDGVVRDAEGAAVPGAQVYMTHRSRVGPPLTTDAGGVYRTAIVHEPGRHVPTQLNVTAPGCAPVVVELYGTARYRCEITLRSGLTTKPAQPVPWETTCEKRE